MLARYFEKPEIGLRIGQGIITQNPASVRGSGKPLYAAFLNAQGRFLHDTFIYDWDMVEGRKLDGEFHPLAE
jgi:folate-binding Fe-S cluster repair protein YgfZ